MSLVRATEMPSASKEGAPMIPQRPATASHPSAMALNLLKKYGRQAQHSKGRGRGARFQRSRFRKPEFSRHGVYNPAKALLAAAGRRKRDSAGLSTGRGKQSPMQRCSDQGKPRFVHLSGVQQVSWQPMSSISNGRVW